MSITASHRESDAITINIAKDFTNAPGGRYCKDGPYSGEEFLDKILRPKYEQAKNERKLLIIELDGVYGYPSSFVSGSFGLLSSECKKRKENLLEHISFVSSSPSRIERFELEIRDPTQREKF